MSSLSPSSANNQSLAVASGLQLTICVHAMLRGNRIPQVEQKDESHAGRPPSQMLKNSCSM